MSVGQENTIMEEEVVSVVAEEGNARTSTSRVQLAEELSIETEDQCYGGFEIFEYDNDVLKNSLLMFFEELIGYLLKKKYREVGYPVDFRFIFRHLTPVFYLFKEDTYGGLLHIVDKFEDDIQEIFKAEKHKIRCGTTARECCDTTLHEFISEMGHKIFTCNHHCSLQSCPQNSDSTIQSNVLVFFAFACRFASLAYLHGMIIAPYIFAEQMTHAVTRIKKRILAVGGWRAISQMCMRLTREPSLVSRIKLFSCDVSPDEENLAFQL